MPIHQLPWLCIHQFSRPLSAAGLGEKDAQYELGLINLNGSRGVKKNVDAALILFEQAAGQNHIDADSALIVMAHKKQCDPETGKKALEKLEDWANKGIAPAQFNLGHLFGSGYLVPRDDRKAMYWYSRCAPKGMIQAYMEIGMLHEKGLGTPQDFQKAFQAYQTAAESGYHSADFYLGRLYEQGLGVGRDDARAIDCYEKAAVVGYRGAMARYGVMQAEGRGIPKNEKAASTWLMQAAAGGDADAQFHLGKLYQRGVINAEIEKKEQFKRWVKLVRGQYYDEKVHSNSQVAKQLFRQAAEQGHAEAAAWLKRDRRITGWFMLIIDIFCLPFGIGIFIWPEVVPQRRKGALTLPHNPFIIRFLSAPLICLMGVGMIGYGVQSLGWFG